MNLKIAGAVCVLLCSGAARANAQGVASSFDQLAVLVETGDTIAVVDATGRKIEGRVWNVAHDALILGTATGPLKFGESDVATISQRRDDSLKNGAIIGAVAATAFFVTAGVALRDHDGGDVIMSGAIAWGALIAGMGAAAGLGIDALITRRHLIYEKSASRNSVSVSPVFGHGRRGAAMTIRF